MFQKTPDISIAMLADPKLRDCCEDFAQGYHIDLPHPVFEWCLTLR